jgi:hypothetical protein
MAEYKGIKGFKVQYLDQDPVPAVAGWTSGGNLNTARYSGAGAGTQTAGLAFGGEAPPVTSQTEEYNGTSWSIGGALPAGVYGVAGCGTQTAGLKIGGADGPGAPLNTCFEYDGSTWSPGGSLVTARSNLSGLGTQTAGLAASGNPGSAPYLSTATEEYDGSTWTAGGALPVAKNTATGGAGTQTAGLIFGGVLPGATATTEEYDGSTWTAGGNLNLARYGTSRAGIQTAALAVAGYDWYSSIQEQQKNMMELLGQLFLLLQQQDMLVLEMVHQLLLFLLEVVIATGNLNSNRRIQCLWRTKHIREPRTSLVQWYYEGFEIY